ncbi:unnamed protein product [Coregonus sp. 'balchen']|nr:unnamed protein product [Coregonus sp. 'balchen']
MKSVVSLLVLLHCCLSGAQVHRDRDGVSVNVIQQVDYEDRESRGNDIQTDKQRAEAAASTHSQQTCQPDIHTVLREMSNMMAEQRVELSHTKTELGAMEARLTASESQVEELKVQLKSKVEELTKRNEDRKVAFSASLAAPGQHGNTGPFNTGITLVYRNIYSNIGNAYNPTTGIFTAPVRGLYLFRFYIYGGGDSSVPTTAALHKNGHQIASAHAVQASGGISSSNGVSVLLEVGDVVNMHLWAGRKIYDDGYRHSTFSGMTMKSVVSLLVLLHCCLSGAQVHRDRDGVSGNEIQQVDYEDRESRGNDIQADKQRAEAAASTHSQQTCQPDIHTVLREMSNMMAEQRVELSHTKTELGAMEARLRDSESRLTASESRLTASESQVEELTNRNEDRKVAFSASLAAPGQHGNTGPFNTGITLVYRNIYSNIGNAYNPTTGIFTAPVRGLYLFRFYIYGGGDSSVPTAAALHKNGHQIAIAYAVHASGGISSSNGVSVVLEVGDVVNMHLWAGTKIYDSTNRHSTFSGHLLFTMS